MGFAFPLSREIATFYNTTSHKLTYLLWGSLAVVSRRHCRKDGGLWEGRDLQVDSSLYTVLREDWRGARTGTGSLGRPGRAAGGGRGAVGRGREGMRVSKQVSLKIIISARPTGEARSKRKGASTSK